MYYNSPAFGTRLAHLTRKGCIVLKGKTEGMSLRTPGQGGLADCRKDFVFIVDVMGIYWKFMIWRANSRFCVAKLG